MTTRLLIVEDQLSSLHAMREYFLAAGYEVDAVSELAEALNHVATRRYSAVITDLRLGTQSNEAGLEVARAAARTGAGIPVVLLTAYSSPDLQQRARTVGVAHVLHKPNTLAELSRLTRDLLSGEAGGAS